jgi:hypothetical protein
MTKLSVSDWKKAKKLKIKKKIRQFYFEWKKTSLKFKKVFLSTEKTNILVLLQTSNNFVPPKTTIKV